MVYIKKLVTVLCFSIHAIINVFLLLNLCGAGGGASFAPQANLVSYNKIFQLPTNLQFQGGICPEKSNLKWPTCGHHLL